MNNAADNAEEDKVIVITDIVVSFLANTNNGRHNDHSVLVIGFVGDDFLVDFNDTDHVLYAYADEDNYDDRNTVSTCNGAMNRRALAVFTRCKITAPLLMILSDCQIKCCSRLMMRSSA